jgi:hypothetical protein
MPFRFNLYLPLFGLGPSSKFISISWASNCSNMLTSCDQFTAPREQFHMNQLHYKRMERKQK